MVTTISENDCDAPGALLYEEQITRGRATASDPGALAPGSYAFSASAMDARGTEIASACVSVVLPSSAPVHVMLTGSGVCVSDGTEPDGRGDAAVDDAGVYADVDGGSGLDAGSATDADAGADAGSDADAGTECDVIDTDRDMTPDCYDGCPVDAQKVLAGACGCGVSDADSDTDGTADCHDGCPVDARKVAPGVCGCGISDADADNDGTADCDDGCPSDVNKTAPGKCGCGQVEGTCLTMADVVGSYERRPILNDWHVGRIVQTTEGVFWINDADVQWTLIPDLANKRLLTTSDCPYYSQPEGKSFVLDVVDGRVTGFRFNYDFFTSLQ